jgi:hypothetical protein
MATKHKIQLLMWQKNRDLSEKLVCLPKDSADKKVSSYA